MRPVRIVKAENGYIVEIDQGNGINKHWLFGNMQEMFATLAKHFNDTDYMQQQMEQAKDVLISSIEQ